MSLLTFLTYEYMDGLFLIIACIIFSCIKIPIWQIGLYSLFLGSFEWATFEYINKLESSGIIGFFLNLLLLGAIVLILFDISFLKSFRISVAAFALLFLGQIIILTPFARIYGIDITEIRDSQYEAIALLILRISQGLLLYLMKGSVKNVKIL